MIHADRLKVATRRLGSFEREMDKEIAAAIAKSSNPKSSTDLITRNLQVRSAIDHFLVFHQTTLIDPVTARGHDAQAARKKLNAQVSRIQRKLIHAEDDADEPDVSTGITASSSSSNARKRPRPE